MSLASFRRRMTMIATSVPVPSAAAASVTWRQFQRALLAAAVALGLGVVIYAAEKYLVVPRRRFMENPADVMMRALGLAHFLVGWLYLFSSPRLRSLPALASLSGWTLVGACLCLVFAWLGAHRNPFVLMAFYSYFLVHEIRDQANLFLSYGEAPPRSPQLASLLFLLRTGMVLLLMTVLIGVHLVHGRWLERVPPLVTFPGEFLLVGWLGLALSALWTIRRAWRLGVAVFGDFTRMAVALGPLLRVYAAIFLILTLGSTLGSVGLNIVILIHVCTWLVYTQRRLAEASAGKERARNAVAGVWVWLRSTPAGFLTLHLGLTALVLALMVLRVYAWERSGWISSAVAGSSFPYWGLMHISMAFWRGK